MEIGVAIGYKDNKYGKWSSNQEGSYGVSPCVTGNAYILETLEGEIFPKVLNEKYLKKNTTPIFGSILEKTDGSYIGRIADTTRN